MSTAVADLRRNVKIRRRQDLFVSVERHLGQRRYLVKDPLALKYYRFREEEWFLLKGLDGKKTLDDLREEFSERFRPKRLAIEDVEQFVRQVLQSGLASVDTPQLGQRLFERRGRMARRKLLQAPQNLLSIKIPLFDPDPLLAWLAPVGRCLFSLTWLLLATLWLLSAVLLIAGHWEEFVRRLPTANEFFTWRNLAWLWLVLGGVKVLHEFGHGLACKRFGGEVHDMGLLFLVFSPCLYCNVSDSWRMSSKWHRAIIGAAGIYVELQLAALALWLWWLSEPGVVHSLCLNAVVVCSVSTVLFNANPLMRFDGYYVLTDLIGVPNLQGRANRRLGNVVSRLTLGAEAVPDPHRPDKGSWLHSALLIAFAAGSYGYRWLVAGGFVVFLTTFLKPYHLVVIGQALAVMAVIGLIVMPVWQIYRTLKTRWTSMRVQPPRAAMGVGVAVVVVGGILFAPLPMRIDVPFILQLRRPAPIYVTVPGLLVEQNVRDGDHVQGGRELALLDNFELAKELSLLELERGRERERLRVADRLDDQAALGEATARYSALGEQIDHLDQQRRQLALRVQNGVAGTVVNPPRPSELGKLLPQGSLFCEIGDPKDLEAYLVVEHSDVALVQMGQRSWLKLPGHSGPILEGAVERIGAADLRDLPAALASVVGGGVAYTQAEEEAENTDAKAQKKAKRAMRPLQRSYAVQVRAPNPDGVLHSGIRGTARIDVGWRTLAWRIDRAIRQTFHFRM